MLGRPLSLTVEGDPTTGQAIDVNAAPRQLLDLRLIGIDRQSYRENLPGGILLLLAQDKHPLDLATSQWADSVEQTWDEVRL